MKWLKKVLGLSGRQKEWRKIEFFDERWRARIEAMAKHIPANSTVLDLGCGQMWTRDFLPEGCTYLPCDYVDRGPGTLVCDFNQGQFPEQHADITFISGCLEYVEDADWFISEVSKASKRCIIAYCIVTPESNPGKRRENAWKNDLTKDALIELFEKHGMNCTSEGGKFMSSFIFCFDHANAKSAG